MAKKRVHEIAKEQGITSKELLAKLQAAGLEVKAAASSVDEDAALAALGNGKGSPEAAKAAKPAEPAKAKPAPPAQEPAPAPEQPPDGAQRQRPTRSSRG